MHISVCAVTALLTFMMGLIFAEPVLAGVSSSDGKRRCWVQPEPKTMVEASYASENQTKYHERQTRVRRIRQPAALVLSDGALRTAVTAGLLVGWSETGYRPDFHVVTAVGPSSLLAPFAFVGSAGDQYVADLFACPSKSWRSMANRAAAMINENILAEIAERHRTGKRLLIAVKGNAARPSGVWDVGWIATFRRGDARSLIQSIFRASVELDGFPDTSTLPPNAAWILPRNLAFRHVGAGRAFLSLPILKVGLRSIYTIHNDVLSPDEHAKFLKKMRAIGRPGTPTKHLELITASDIARIAHARNQFFRFATGKKQRWFFPRTLFDANYTRAVFTKAYRSARMRRIWRSQVPRSDR